MKNRKHVDALSEPRQASGAGLLVRRGRILALAGVLAVAPMVTGFPQVSSPAKAHPVKSHAHKVRFVKSSVAAMRTARDATRSVVRTPGAPDPITTARAVAVTPVQDVAGPVTVVGVTWPKSATPAKDNYQIRTLTGAAWSQWTSLGIIDGGPDGAEAASAVTGTNPYFVTGASKYEVRSLTTAALVSTAATVEVVDPGTSNADNVGQAPGAAAAATVKPTIYARADWGVDETLRRGTPLYGQVQLGFVHHTADDPDPLTANSYAAADVPGIIRGMYAYHLGLGWDDIGYNFLIDRFGRTWEGRFGGVDKAVVGAHTLSYNPVSTGVAAIGNFDIAPAPPAVTDAFKQIFAWKFSLAGIPATGASPVLAPDGLTPLQRVSGHSDAYATLCPGQYLKEKLPEIQAGVNAIMTTSPIGGWPGLFSPGDFTGDGKADILGLKSNGELYLYRGNGVVGFSGTGTRIGTGWGGFFKIFSPGDFTGDHRSDILAIKSNGELYVYRGNGRGGFAGAGVRIGTGWGGFAKVFSPGDFTGDGKADILGIKGNGDLYLYRGNGLGGLTGAGVRIGTGWASFATLFSPGDFTGDRKSDILGVNGNGEMYLYRGNGLGRFTGPGVRIGTGWGGFVKIFSPGDFTGDHLSDLLAVKSTGELYLYRGNGLGRFIGAGVRIGTGWGGFV